MTLEEIDKKIATLSRDVAHYHQTVKDRYSTLDARLDSTLDAAAKSKWTPVGFALFTVALLWIGMAFERWL